MSNETEWVLVPREKLEQVADGIFSKHHNAEENKDAYDVAYFGAMLKDVEEMLSSAPQPPAEAQAQGGGEVEYEFEVWQDNSLQAGGSTSDYATAKSEADHYARMYGQDGPVEVRMYEKRQFTSPPSASEAQPVASGWCDACEGAGHTPDAADPFARPVCCPDCAGSGLAEHSITANEAPSAPVGVEEAVQAIMHEVFKYADVAAPLRGPPMTQDESFPARRASLTQDKVIRDMLYALAQQPAAVDEALSVGQRVEWQDNVGRWWPCRITGRSPATYTAQLDDGTDAEEYARGRFRALAAQQPASCPKCGGTGEADSGGIMPWGAPAMILCECQQPAAADEAMVERALAEWKRLEGHQTDAVRMSAALQEALAAQPGGSDNDH